MKKRDNTEDLGSVIKRVFTQGRLRKPFFENQIQLFFENRFGNHFSSSIHQLFLKDQTLYLKIQSSSFRNELQLQKELLRKKLNQQLGEDYVLDIKFI
jgi:hypothetical protein